LPIIYNDITLACIDRIPIQQTQIKTAKRNEQSLSINCRTIFRPLQCHRSVGPLSRDDKRRIFNIVSYVQQWQTFASYERTLQHKVAATTDGVSHTFQLRKLATQHKHGKTLDDRAVPNTPSCILFNSNCSPNSMYSHLVKQLNTLKCGWLKMTKPGRWHTASKCVL